VRKLERLLNLTAALLETGRPLTAEEIHRRVPDYPDAQPSFHRAFERDKDDLREMGVPIELIPIPGADPPVDGYQIPKRRYFLPDAGLDPEELAALRLAAGAVRLEGLDGAEALWKLGGNPDAGAATPTSDQLRLPTDPSLAPLFAAIAERRVVTFDYRSEQREVEPWRLDFRRGWWYLTGFDRQRAEDRQFRVDRLEGAVRSGEPNAFERPLETGPRSEPAWQLGGDASVDVRLLVDAEQAPWAVHHLEAEALEETRADGSVVLSVFVTNRPAFRSFVITFLDHAEILSPPEVRDEFVDWLRECAR
jgi:proteasome accessory factor B